MEAFLKVMGSLYDETRVRLLAFLAEHGPLCVCDLAESFAMGQSRLSRHLKILKEAGFLEVERRGKWHYYALASKLAPLQRDLVRHIKSLQLDLPPLRKTSQECRI